MEDVAKSFLTQFPAAAVAVLILWHYSRQVISQRKEDAERCDRTILDLSNRLRQIEDGRLADAQSSAATLSEKMDSLIVSIKEAGSGVHRIPTNTEHG